MDYVRFNNLTDTFLMATGQEDEVVRSEGKVGCCPGKRFLDRWVCAHSAIELAGALLGTLPRASR